MKRSKSPHYIYKENAEILWGIPEKALTQSWLIDIREHMFINSHFYCNGSELNFCKCTTTCTLNKLTVNPVEFLSCLPCYINPLGLGVIASIAG